MARRTSNPVQLRWFAAMVTLVVVLQAGVAGWGYLYNETDGQYAGAAKVMASGGSWLVPENNGVPRLVKPPLYYWMLASSLWAFGTNEFAARLPGAIGVMFWAAAVFAVAQHWGSARRGFLAGSILVACVGTATLGRIVMPEVWFCAFVAWAAYFALRLVSQREGGGGWAVLFWLAAALACFVKGPHGPVFGLAIGAGYAIFLKRPKRLLHLLSPVGIILFLAINVPWHAYVESRYPGYLANLLLVEHLGHVTGSDAPATSYTDVPRLQFLALQLLWLFPWSFLLGWMGISRWVAHRRGRVRHRSDGPGKWAFPAIWAGVILVPLLVVGQRQDYYAMAMWPAAALVAAALIGRGSIRWPSVGLLVLTLAMLGAANLMHLVGEAGDTAPLEERATAWTTLRGFDAAVWGSLVRIASVSFGGAAVFLVLAIVFSRRFQGRLALLGAGAAFHLGAVAGMAAVAPYFSLGPAASQIVSATRGDDVLLAFEGNIDTASSLLFYTPKRVHLVGADPDADFVIRKFRIGSTRYWSEAELAGRWAGGGRIVFVTEQSRLPEWELLLGDKPEIVARSGTLVAIRPKREE